MPTIPTSIWLALKARAQSLVLSPAHQVAWPNEAFSPPTTPYLRVTHFPNKTDRLFLNRGDADRYAGILQVAVMSPLNQNAAVATEVAGLIAAHFPADLRIRYDGVTVQIEKTPDIAQGMRDDATQRWMTPVSIRYFVLNH